MWVVCTQTALAKGVHLASRAISSRTTMPILGYILLETLKNGVRLTATDLELAVQVDIDAEVKRGGQVTLPAKILAEIVGNLPEATVELKREEGSHQVEITCEASAFEILGLPPDDFPALPKGEGAEVGAIDADLLRKMVSQTIFAVSADETRPFLTGVYVTMEGAEVRCVATDGGRLALRKAALDSPAKQKLGAIVPAKAMQELMRALAGAAGEVRVSMVDNQLLFAVPGLRIYSRLIGGQFPNYQQVIPQEFKQRIRVPTERLLRAVRRVAITARDSANVVRIAARGNRLVITSNTPEVGKAREEVEVASEGDTVEAAFNARYLMDCLNTIDADELYFDLTGQLSPGTLRPTGHTDYVYVLAPVRVYG
ncbi:MAG: DNA polymerase III subunit beta [Armatimonadota bacterium]|nr:DNA polymerase III subunit beta [Armatimonadota bacterium]MDR7451079.1 DNA polymerase III subunit beta [Armatimonadota bacterium]MDR7465900.1 DNA polymerase III subunit beta [Armatimonadota bacterium]MDR7493965.1 DNA polymerase III subunit beta [Armatimonadota bacterium]MDR7498415.1 DNA polymerase III subunit beta [Armatimonadota bacterium]